MPPGPGDGWGFPNDNPDRYGWVDYGVYLPLGADRTAEYYFPRYFAVPPEQMFIQTYYNPFETRGQRYIPYAEPAETIRWGARRLRRPTCRFLPTRPSPTRARGHGPSLERQGRGTAASVGRFGIDPVIERPPGTRSVASRRRARRSVSAGDSRRRGTPPGLALRGCSGSCQSCHGLLA